jgi:hypothetical protein
VGANTSSDYFAVPVLCEDVGKWHNYKVCRQMREIADDRLSDFEDGPILLAVSRRYPRRICMIWPVTVIKTG